VSKVINSKKTYDQIIFRTETLEPGIYICELWVTNKRKTTAKLIIVNQ